MNQNIITLKEDLTNNKPTVLFLGAGINNSKNVNMNWDGLLRHLIKYALVDYNQEEQNAFLGKNITWDDNCLQRIDATRIKNELDIQQYISSEFPSEILTYIIKKKLKDSYILLIQNFLYSNCNKDILSKAVNEYLEYKNGRKELEDVPFYTLFILAELILKYTCIKSIITYNYDNFLSIAVRLLKDKGIGNRNSNFKIIEIHNGCSNEISGNDCLLVYHIHGYIASPENIQINNENNNIVLSIDEFYDSAREVFSWQTATQLHFLTHYTCLFSGISISDITTQRMISYANLKKNPSNVYNLRALFNNNQSEDYNKLKLKLHLKKNLFYEDMGMKVINSNNGYTDLYNQIYEQLIIR